VHPLLPYLGASGVLKISLVAHGPVPRETVPSPFVILADPDPFSVLIQARFLTDAGSELTQVFLLIQRDAYHCPGAGTRPITNRDIEHAWQQAYDYYLRANNPHPALILSGRLTEGGRAARLPSLFYCTKTEAFFVPPCPKCGRPLGQCEDDVQLEKAGLQPYTSSLKRYLYCASCGGQEPRSFYVKERDRTDPPELSDQEELIHAFGRCREVADPETRFPCPACPHHSECYEPGNLARKRIAALSFYPFYLLAFEAMSVCAAEFVALLSGATINDLAVSLQGRGEQGRMGLLRVLGARGGPGAPFLFEGDERWFLEVLYLKLSFLGEALRAIVAESDILRHPEMAPSMEGLWVKVPDQNGLLPWLWNFRVQMIDIGSRMPSTLLFPDRSGPYGRHILGLLWFEALIANRRQGSAEVHDALSLATGNCPLDDERFVDRNFRGRLNPAFQPENIFWEPDGKRVNDAWTALWEEALRLGWTLLVADSRRSPEWSAERFQGELESLRREVRDALFPKHPTGIRQGGVVRGNEKEVPSIPPRPRTGEDEAIRSILERIRGRWKGSGEPQIKEAAEEEMLEKTRILRVAETRQPSDAVHPEERRDEEEAIFVETVILSPAGASGRPTSSPAPAAAPAPHPSQKDVAPQSSTEAGEEELEKTMILDASKLRGKGRDGSKR
jgi:hypothetical protein